MLHSVHTYQNSAAWNYFDQILLYTFDFLFTSIFQTFLIEVVSKIMMRTAFFLLLVAAFTLANEEATLDGSFVSEQRGYFKREHSLIKPYQSAGMDVP